jgi:serine/threonine-protein kinase
MGEVYRARDTNLNRDVALKVLPETFANDPDRLARFTREAQTLAALNHSNIAHIHGLEESTPVRALVMELVEGATLADRIAQGPIPLAEALPIARQITEALEAAHEQGIIHRDLKPANIKVRTDGSVKLLDFGIAKAMHPSSSSSAASATISVSIGLTGVGVILGTASYMSPEQASGKVVDKRTDIWAFGCVLYEMLTGARAFRGDDATATIAAVITEEPDWTTLRAETPAAIRRLLRRCLEKDRRRRLSDAADVGLEIDDALTPPSGSVNVATLANRPANHRGWSWAVASGLGLGLGAAVVFLLLQPWGRVPPLALRLSAELGVDAVLATDQGDAAILSPDGAVVAFVAQKGAGGAPQLYVRRLTQLQATPLLGTDAADSPFFAPDGQWLAFFAGGKLKKVSVTGGAVVTLCDAPIGRGGAWGDDGWIVFSPNSAPGVNLLRVSSSGGKPEPLMSLAEDEVTQRWPQVLPGGKAVLFTGASTTGAYDDANLVVQALPTGARKVVLRGGYHGRYVPSGHLVYVHDRTLFAAPFDLGRLEVTGQAVPVLVGVTSNPLTGGAQFAVSSTGTLVYLPGQSTSGAKPIHWMGREGKTTPIRDTPANWFDLLFSPDGRRLAVEINEGGSDIWVYEWARDTLIRLTSDPADDEKPVWTPDGRRIVFASRRAEDSTSNLYWQSADGTGNAQRLTESKNRQYPASWHPSGKFLAFQELNPQTNFDLMILPMEGDDGSGWKAGTPTVFLTSPSDDREPMFSPDGRWLAYQSNESGRSEVYVQPFSGAGGRWKISSGGGVYPTWSRTKHELFFGTNEGQIMVAAFTVEGDSFRAEKPILWSNGRHVARAFSRGFDLHPDGERFALAPGGQTADGAQQSHLTFIFNFFDELSRIAPARAR